jgi:probable HAF family extracellular repeat protein
MAYGMALTCLVSGEAEAAQRYTLTVFDTGGLFAAPWAINNSGKVVGSVGGKAAIITEKGYELIATGAEYDSYARAINDNGTIIVESTDLYTPGSYIVKNGISTQILGPNGPNVSVYGLNNKDQIAGNGRGNSAFFGSIGALQQVSGNLLAINDAGMAVGTNGYNAIQVTSSGTKDIGSLGYGALAWSVNESGQVVGQSYISEFYRQAAFIYSDGKMTAINQPTWIDAIGYSINESGIVVGDASERNSTRKAWVYSNGTVSYLNDLVDNLNGFNITYARAINDVGQIVGFGYDSQLGRGSGYVLTPIAAAIPEPATWAMMLVGFAMVGATARYRRRKVDVTFA